MKLTDDIVNFTRIQRKWTEIKSREKVFLSLKTYRGQALFRKHWREHDKKQLFKASDCDYAFISDQISELFKRILICELG